MLRKLSKTFWCISAASLCLMIGSALWNAQAAAQGSDAAHGGKSGSGGPEKKEMTFEVISLSPVKPGSSPYDGSAAPMGNTDPTPTGFRSALTVSLMLMIAYAPSDQLDTMPMVNAPKWIYSPNVDWYVVNARVADADVEAWRHQSAHHELLRSAMRDLLKKRFNLVAHEQPAELPDWKLVIGKKGLRMKPTTPGSALPAKGSPLRSGGVRIADGPGDRTTWHYYGATIWELVDFLGKCSPDRPVHDETGLTGRYDFAIQSVAEPFRERDEQIYNWPVDPLGLELKPGKYSGFRLVIDHLDEKPSPN